MKTIFNPLNSCILIQIKLILKRFNLNPQPYLNKISKQKNKIQYNLKFDLMRFFTILDGTQILEEIYSKKSLENIFLFGGK